MPSRNTIRGVLGLVLYAGLLFGGAGTWRWTEGWIFFGWNVLAMAGTGLWLKRRDPALFRAVFNRVVDNGKMLRTFVQVIRSGATGRKSLGSAPKAMVQTWLNGASDRALLQANIGNDPSLADVIRMVHPKPETREREALYAWIVGRPCEARIVASPSGMRIRPTRRASDTRHRGKPVTCCTPRFADVGFTTGTPDIRLQRRRHLR